MKTKAAVTWKAGQPLTIETVDLQGPKFGEVLVEIKATGICHTDYYSFECIGNTQVMHQALEDINQGFELMKRGESIRGVVLY